MKIQQYKQSTVESCLACCLYQLSREKITIKKEREMLFYALKFSRNDFVTGHLDLFEKNTGLKTIRYVHNTILYNHVKKESTTSLKQKEITINLINKILRKKSLILVLDAYQLFQSFHYPHWILILKRQKKKYLIYEPWDGIVKEISSKTLKESIKSYLINLWMSPQIITLKFR